MTKQEIFDKVATHLLAQGKPSFTRFGGCQYRGPNGAKCAAGVLIPDDLYDPGYEGDAADHLPARVMEVFGEHRDFVLTLQIAHDTAAGSSVWLSAWKGRMREIAKEFDLSDAVLGE
jgi:hypothetical protein